MRRWLHSSLVRLLFHLRLSRLYSCRCRIRDSRYIRSWLDSGTTYWRRVAVTLLSWFLGWSIIGGLHLSLRWFDNIIVWWIFGVNLIEVKSIKLLQQSILICLRSSSSTHTVFGNWRCILPFGVNVRRCVPKVGTLILLGRIEVLIWEGMRIVRNFILLTLWGLHRISYPD